MAERPYISKNVLNDTNYITSHNDNSRDKNNKVKYLFFGNPNYTWINKTTTMRNTDTLLQPFLYEIKSYIRDDIQFLSPYHKKKKRFFGFIWRHKPLK